MDALRYSNYDIVFQEVPGEVTLAINITGCPHRCPGCHSEYLWEYFGEPLLENLDTILAKYDGLISCVCFMGGDQNTNDLESALKTVKMHSLSAGIYSGANEASIFDDLLPLIDYLKIGSYTESLGGLSSPNTNQRFYEVKNGELIDKTDEFLK